MEERFDTILKERIETLPKHQPGNFLWGMISDQMDFEDRLAEKLPNLPGHIADNNIWTIVEPVLEKENKFKIKKIHYWAAAASLALIIGIGVYFLTNDGARVEISQETEENWQVDDVLATSPERGIMDYMSSLCDDKTYVTQETEFCEKNKELQQIDNELSKLNKVIEKYGSSQSLVLTRIKLENTKAALIKDLVKKLSS